MNVDNMNDIEMPMPPKTQIQLLSIPSDTLVEGDLYAMLLMGTNTWSYGVYTGDSLRITDTEKIPLEFEYSRKLCYARTGTGRWDSSLASFHALTVDVESMVYTWKAKEAANGNWGWGGPEAERPLQRVGWTLTEHLHEQAWARRKHAVTAWAAVYAAKFAAETGA